LAKADWHRQERYRTFDPSGESAGFGRSGINHLPTYLYQNTMALINVNLRIVGLYFNEMVIVDDNDVTKPITVRDVLDAYIKANPTLAKPGGLEYNRFPIGGRDFVTAFTYHFPGTFNFDGNDTVIIPPDGPSLGDQTRPAGIYTMAEALEDRFTDKSVGLVWQYYVVASDGTLKSKTPESRGFNGFDERLPIPLAGTNPPPFLANNDTIIWRLVAIARKPNFL
jgi:hypothetical protein